MGKGEKFIALANYFKNINREQIKLAFNEIEEIIGEKLCKSAYKYKAYWYLSDTHTFPSVWLQEGYKLKSLDLNRKVAIFIKNESNIIPNNIKNTKVKDNLDNKVINCEEDIRKIIFKYHKEIVEDENGRYKSWEHCHEYFIKNKDEVNEETIDILCLHLAFYLASWGMYRGSAFLLQKDYKVHYEAVKEIIQPKYKELWDINSERLIEDKNLELLFNISAKIKEIYIRKRKNIDGHINVSDTLITKILMGTFGCVPAYDRFFVDGIKIKKVATGNFNKKSIISLIKFYLNNKEKLEECSLIIDENGVKYPEMKLIDMYFWQIGFDKENNNKENVLLKEF